MINPAYKIKTDRLLLRCLEPADAVSLKKAIDQNIDHLLPWMPWAKDEPEELEKKIERIRRFRANFDMDKSYIYGIFFPDNADLTGVIGAHESVRDRVREIGYWLRKDCTGYGYVTEAAAALIKVLFETDAAERIEIHCDSKNTKSSAVPNRLGFNREAVIRINTKDNQGERKRDEIWVLFQEEYKNTAAYNIKIQAFDAIGRKIEMK